MKYMRMRWMGHVAYEVCLKSNESGAIKFFINNWIANQHYPFKVVPLGSHTPPEMLPPLPVAVLEVFTWKCPQLVCHDVLDVVHNSKVMTFEVEFEFREMKKSHGPRSGEYGGCRTTGIPFLVRNSFMEVAVWQTVLLWCSIQVSTESGWTWWTLFLNCSRTSW